MLILGVVLLGAVLSIGLKAYPYGRTGVEVVYVVGSSPAFGQIKSGMIVTKLNGQPVASSEDWNARTAGFNGTVAITANGKDYSFASNGSLGISVMDMERTNLDFGLDLRGGTRIILKPVGANITRDVVEQTIATLQTRANMYGLKEMKFFPVGVGNDYYIQIEAAGVGSDIVDNLLSTQGNFMAKVSKPVKLSGGSGTILLGDRNYPITASDGSMTVDGIAVENATFVLENITFEAVNVTSSGLTLLADVYGGSDIELVKTDPQSSGVVPVSGGYQFYFVVMVSTQGAERFAKVTSGVPRFMDVQSGEEYIDSNIYLYLDNKLVSSLRIGADLAGKIYQTPQVQGFRQTLEGATAEKLQLQTILRSGALPARLETASVDIISPTLGSNFFRSAAYAAVLAAAIVVCIVFTRYRSLKVALPIAGISLSEVVIMLGIAATGDYAIWGVVLVVNLVIISFAWWKKQEVDMLAWIGALLVPMLGMLSWTIDLPAIGGMIAALGTGVDQQIIIADESIRGGRERAALTLKEKIKRAFFIVFCAAATTIGAMLPLMFLGIGLVKGFAITTIVGVLVGVLIARPAYARIVEMTISGRHKAEKAKPQNIQPEKVA